MSKQDLGAEIAALHSEIQALRSEVQVLKDIEAIKQLRWAYFQAINGGRFSECSSYFADESSYDTEVAGNYPNRAEIEKFFSEIMPLASYTMDLAINPVIEVTGDRATGRYFLFNPFTTRDGKAAWTMGIIEDEYVREHGEWKISKGRLTFHHVASYRKGWGTTHQDSENRQE